MKCERRGPSDTLLARFARNLTATASVGWVGSVETCGVPTVAIQTHRYNLGLSGGGSMSRAQAAVRSKTTPQVITS